MWELAKENSIQTHKTWSENAVDATVKFYNNAGKDVSTLIDLQETNQMIVDQLSLAQKTANIEDSTEDGLAPAISNMTAEQKCYSKVFINQAYEKWNGAGIDKISLKQQNENPTFTGNEVIFPGGTDQVTNVMAKGLNILVDKNVEFIDYTESEVKITTNEGEIFYSDSVIITAPLGVLKMGKIRFSPLLPNWKIEAIDQMGAGTLDKLVLEFPSVFWDDVDLIEYADSTKESVYWSGTLNLYKQLGLKGLMMFNIGDEAIELSKWTDQQVIDSAIGVLRNMYGDDIPGHVNYLRSNWLKDEGSFEAFSYFAKGTSPTVQENLCMNLNGKVFFAGEHCSPYIGTIHGAYLSGDGAAELLKRLA